MPRADDAGHERALLGTERILGEELLTHSYVMVETVSLVRVAGGSDELRVHAYARHLTRLHPGRRLRGGGLRAHQLTAHAAAPKP